MRSLRDVRISVNIKMFYSLITLFLIASVCKSSEISNENSDDQEPYQTYAIGPFWTFPIKNDGHKVHQSDYYKNLNSDHFRFKRETKNDSSQRDTEISDHEYPKKISTSPDYRNKGRWSKGEIPGKKVDLGFVPLQIYTQVRRYDTVQHLPQSAAVAEASTQEDIINAPRLKEVLRHKKIQQVYEEEGYEDSGYDHGGYNHHGAKYEEIENNEKVDAKKTDSDAQLRSAEDIGVYADPAGDVLNEAGNPISGGSWKNQISERAQKSLKWDGDGNVTVVIEEAPLVFEDDSRKYILIDGKRVPIYKNTLKESGIKNKTTTIFLPETSIETKDKSRERLEESRETVENVDKAESRSGVEDETDHNAEGRVINNGRTKGSTIVVFPGISTKREYPTDQLNDNWKPMAPEDVYVQGVGYNSRRFSSPNLPNLPLVHNVHHYNSYIPKFPSYYSDNPISFPSQSSPVLKPSPKPYFSTTNLTPASTHLVNANKRPMQFTSAGTLNTYATLITGNIATTTTTLPAPSPSNYAQLIQPRYNKSSDFSWAPSNLYETKLIMDPAKTKNVSVGRKYNNFTRLNPSHKTDIADFSSTRSWSFGYPLLNTRHPSLPLESNHQYNQSVDDSYAAPLVSKKSTSESETGPVKYIEQLTIAHFSSQENANVPTALPLVQNDRLIKLAKHLNAQSHHENYSRQKRDTSQVSYDALKYPYYQMVSNRNKGSKDSALKYATNHVLIPRKTKAGMEFYEARDKLIRCKDPSPPEDVIPKREEDGEWNRKPQPDLPRIKDLGDTIECFKYKYFGKEPLDNPFFQEEKIGTPQNFHLDKEVDNYKRKFALHSNKNNNNKRVMIVPPLENTTDSSRYLNNHKMTGNTSTTFVYKNHRPEEATNSSSVKNTMITSPFKFEGEHAEKYNSYPTYEQPKENDNFEIETSHKHKHYKPYYFHSHHHLHKRKKLRPETHLPVSIYSIISTNEYPSFYLPLIYAHSLKSQKVSPLYRGVPPHISDNVASDSENSYQTKSPTLYIVRPGKHSEDRGIPSKKNESTSIWNFMNPFKWFPSLFTNRRNEPKYRRRRSSDYVAYDKVLSRENRKEDKIFEEGSSQFESDSPINQKLETTTGPPISLSEFKSKMNITDNRQARLNRLTGGFISRNNTFISNSKPIHLNSFTTVTTTPLSSTEPTSRSVEAPTAKSRFLFPRTKIPKRRSKQQKKTNDNRRDTFVGTSTTSSTTTTPASTVTTRMYKPKHDIKKNYEVRTPFNVFTVLKKPKQILTTESPFESKEIQSGSEENPRRMQQVEHRRVTKEEVYKTTYIPEEEATENADTVISGEEIQYAMSNPDGRNPVDKNEPSHNQTLTYLVDSVTGAGSWGGQTKKRGLQPKRRQTRRQENGESYKSVYLYPKTGLRRGSTEERALERSHSGPRVKVKKQKNTPEYGKEAYIVSLLSKVPPLTNQPHYSNGRKRPSHQAKPKKFRSEKSADYNESDELDSIVQEGDEETQEEIYPPPTRSTPNYILDPGKRKYYYVKE